MSWEELRGEHRYKGEDAGCVSISVWEPYNENRSIEFCLSGDDVGLDEEGLKRLAVIMLADINDQIGRAKDGGRAED